METWKSSCIVASKIVRKRILPLTNSIRIHMQLLFRVIISVLFIFENEFHFLMQVSNASFFPEKQEENLQIFKIAHIGHIYIIAVLAEFFKKSVSGPTKLWKSFLYELSSEDKILIRSFRRIWVSRIRGHCIFQTVLPDWDQNSWAARRRPSWGKPSRCPPVPRWCASSSRSAAASRRIESRFSANQKQLFEFQHQLDDIEFSISSSSLYCVGQLGKSSLVNKLRECLRVCAQRSPIDLLSF